MTTESTAGRSAVARTRPERWFQPGDVVRMVWAWFIGALALVITGALLPGLTADHARDYLWVAIGAAVVGAIVRPLLVTVSAIIGWIAVFAARDRRTGADPRRGDRPGPRGSLGLLRHDDRGGVPLFRRHHVAVVARDGGHGRGLHGISAQASSEPVGIGDRSGSRRCRLRPARRGLVPGVALGRPGGSPADDQSLAVGRLAPDARVARPDPVHDAGESAGHPARERRRRAGVPLVRPRHRPGARCEPSC